MGGLPNKSQKKETLFIFFVVVVALIFTGFINYYFGYNEGFNSALDENYKKSFEEFVTTENNLWERDKFWNESYENDYYEHGYPLFWADTSYLEELCEQDEKNCFHPEEQKEATAVVLPVDNSFCGGFCAKDDSEVDEYCDFNYFNGTKPIASYYRKGEKIFELKADKDNFYCFEKNGELTDLNYCYAAGL